MVRRNRGSRRRRRKRRGAAGAAVRNRDAAVRDPGTDDIGPQGHARPERVRGSALRLALGERQAVGRADQLRRPGRRQGHQALLPHCRMGRQ